MSGGNRKENAMSDGGFRSTRGEFVKAAGIGVATIAVGGSALAALRGTTAAAQSSPVSARDHVVLTGQTLRMAATDGYATMPGRENDPLYIFGFIPVPDDTVAHLVSDFRGRAQMAAPILDFTEGDNITITLTNLGLIQRPDLTDSHTIHWHGFRTPSALFDGVPEVSIAVPIAKQFTYFYRPHDVGTYMYHCHFEDVEHVQMGMTSIVFVRPADHPNWAYDDASTEFDRHFAMLENEVWSAFHDGDRDIQESIPTDYAPQWFTLNGRAYPQTILPNDDSSLDADQRIPTYNANNDDQEYSQPVSSLAQVNGGDRVLFRLANLGYQQHAMELPGIPMRVIGQDATFLGPHAGYLGVDYGERRYSTNTVYIGPGEARDVLFTAPDYNSANPSGTDSVGPYNVYHFRNRDFRKLSNDGAAGPGGMMTEVRVYDGALPAFNAAGPIPANVTYPPGP
jgi:FtsP/CotA-like multicopper oxidase with cupredoxin domain